MISRIWSSSRKKKKEKKIVIDLRVIYYLSDYIEFEVFTLFVPSLFLFIKSNVETSIEISFKLFTSEFDLSTYLPT